MTLTRQIGELPFSSTLLYDEYKGDFHALGSAAESRLAAARTSRDGSLLAQALLARGLAHLLQGETPAARGCFAEVAKLAPAQAAWQLRAAAFGKLATQLHLNTFPGGISANGAEHEAHSDELSEAAAALEQRRAALATADPATRIDVAAAGSLLSMLPTARGYFANIDQYTAELVQMAVQLALVPVEGFREQTAGLELGPGLAAYLDLVTADLLRRSRRPAEAELHLSRARGGYQQAVDRAGFAASLLLEGDWLTAPNSSPIAWNCILQEGQENNAISDEPREFDRSKVDLAGGRALYARAGRLFAADDSVRGAAAVALRLGYLAMLEGQYGEAQRQAEAARGHSTAAGDTLGVHTAALHRALCLIGAGNLVEDQTTAQAVGAWGREQGSLSFCVGLGLLCARVGRRWLIHEGDYERALACFRLGEGLFEALGTRTNAAQCAADQAATYRQIGELAAALAAFERAQTLYGEAGKGGPTAAIAALRSALLATQIYELYSSRQDGEQMERVASEHAARYERALALADVAQRPVLSQVLEIAMRAQVDDGRFYAPLFRALRARDAGETLQAEAGFAAALAAASQVGGAQGEFLAAVALGHQRRYEEATAAYRRHLTAGGPFTAIQAMFAAVVDTQGSGWLDEEQRKNLLRSHDQAATMFLRLKQYADAQHHFAQLEQLGGTEWWRSSSAPWLSLADYGELYEGLDDLPRALHSYEQGIALLEERRAELSRSELRVALSGDKSVQYLYFNATRATLRLHLQAQARGDAPTANELAAHAFDLAERSKARSLLDLMASGAASPRAPGDETDVLFGWRQRTAQLDLWRGLLARELGLSQRDEGRVALLQAQIEDAESAVRELEAELARINPHFYRLINPQADVISLDELRALLPPDTALLQYMFLGDDLLCWAVSHEGMVAAFHGEVEVRALNRAIGELHRRCRRREPLDALATYLAEQLLRPLEQVIARHSRLVIVPYGSSHKLPFHALPWAGQPLIAGHSVSYLPSASAARFLAKHDGPLRTERVLAIGDPADMAYRPPLGGTQRSAPGLRGAAAEARVVAGLFPGGLALTGEAATLDAVSARIAAYPILHFATHGYLSEEAPLLSSILLAHSAALTVLDLTGLRLDADLVVLSACNTAQGETTGGDDLLGLTRGLLAAGARAAVVSLWPVADHATSLLMEVFYQGLKQGRSPHTALKEAELHLRRLGAQEATSELRRLALRDLGDESADSSDQPSDIAYAHPFFWAPFILIGL